MSPLPLGIVASAGAAPAGDFQLISTTELVSSTTVTFSNIPQTFRHLQLRMVITGAGAPGSPMRFNNDSSGNYATHFMWGTGTAVQSVGYANQTELNGPSGGTSPQFSAAIMDILDYSSTTKFKTTRSLQSEVSSRVFLVSNLWRSTAAITTISFGTFAAGCRISLYGIKG